MKHNTPLCMLLCGLLCLLASCDRKEVRFIYSPATPHAGETVRFTNQTEEGEEWEWNFGDGTSSSTKSPNKVYKRAGNYTVTLKVDGKAHRSYSLTLTVIDTVPSIGLVGDTLVQYCTPITLGMNLYNPYSAATTFCWETGEDVRILKGDSSKQQIKVLFLRHDADVPVHCHYTIGEESGTIDTTFHVQDVAAPALLLHDATTRYRLRLFANGTEEPVADGASEAATVCPDYTFSGNVFRLMASGIERDGEVMVAGAVRMFTIDPIARKLYYTTTDGTLSVCHLNGKQAVVLAEHATALGLIVDNALNRIYWTAEDGVWYLPLVQTQNNSTTDEAVHLSAIGGVLWLGIDSEPRLCTSKHE